MEKLKNISAVLILFVFLLSASCKKDTIIEPTKPNYSPKANLDLGSKVTVQGFDYTNNQETSLTTVSVTNLGNLISCTSIAEYISYTIDSDPTVFVFAPISCKSEIDPLTGILGSSFYLNGSTPTTVTLKL